MGEQQTVEQALQDFRRVSEVALTAIQGQLALLLQRQDQTERRADVQDSRLAHLDTRVDLIDKTAVTREDLEKNQQAAKAEIDKSKVRIIMWSALIVSIVGLLTGTLSTVIIPLATK